MRKKSIVIWDIIIFAMFMFSSCQTKEERVISKFENLVERVDKKSADFSDEDWDEVFAEYEEIHKEASKCKFTKEQQKEFYRIEGLMTSVVIRESSKQVGRNLVNFLTNGKTMVEGFLEGFGEGVLSE